jgi:hypothetical protein
LQAFDAALVDNRWSWHGVVVAWEERLLAVLDDLEQQAEGLSLAARETDVAELGRAEYAEVDLAARLHASVGRVVQLDLAGWGRRDVLLERVGRGCAVARELRPGSPAAVLNLDHLRGAAGLDPGARPEELRRVTARLGLASALRHLAEEVDRVTVVRTDGEHRTGALARLGADFLELVGETGRVEVVPLAVTVAVWPA